MSDSGGISLPAQPARAPGIPENFQPLAFEKFESLNTKPSRPAISPAEMFWCDGWMPIGPSNLRVLPGIGPSAFQVPGAQIVQWFNFGNIGDTPYGLALLSDGSLWAFNTQTNAAQQVMSAGTIQSPSSIMGFSQWGSLYLIFAKDQPNGYWLWDGTNLYTSGTIGPEVAIDNGGSNYTTDPIVTFQTTAVGATVPTFAAQVDVNGSVTKVSVTSPGSGFGVNDLVSLGFSGGGTDDQAIAGSISPTVNTGGVSQVIITDGGHAYTGRAQVVFSGGGGTGASASCSVSNGAITAIAIINPGTGYTTQPTVSITDPGIPGNPSIPGGSGFTGFTNIAFGQITSIPVNAGGSGYVTPPTVQILGDGTGAQGIAHINGGVVVNVEMQNYGSGYTKALAVFQGGNNAANATPLLMPFGISGTAVEVYQSRVWVTNGAAAATFPPKNRTLFSSANSAIDFGDNGGAFQSTDSFLRVGYHWLKQTNGFLYLGGDSSINYISGVTTSTPSGGTVAVTTFGNINVDPQLGSAWPSSVQVFSRNIVFANSIGIFVSYGGAVTKASLPLDGFYFTGPVFGNQGATDFPSAVAEIYGIPVYMLLLPVVDQFSGQLVNKLLMWDGKHWFTSQQNNPLTYIATQEINSVLTAWGTDGTYIFPLFATPATNFLKVVQSKLHADPSYWTTKTAIRLHGIVRTYVVDEPLNISIDNENGLGTGNAFYSILPVGTNVSLTNTLGQPVALTNSLGQAVTTSGPGLDVFGPLPVGQSGRLLGFTIQTNASDLALLSIGAATQIYSTNL